MRVIIVGAGIAGLSLALTLHRNGHQALVVEKAPQLRGGGYMIDFFGPGYDAAEKLGLIPELRKIHYPIPYLSYVNEHGKERFALRYKDVRKLLDNRHFNFMRGDLEKLMYAQVKDKVEMRFGTTLSSFEQYGEQVHTCLSDGTTGSFDLLVGADGVHSSVRSLVFGEESRFLRPLGYNTAAYIIEDAQSLDVRRDAFQTLTEPHRQVAVYPIQGGRVATFFVYKAQEEHHQHFASYSYSHEAARAELRRVYGDMGWIVPALLEYGRQAPDSYFDSVSQIEMPRWRAGRVVLMGDACQCVSLLAGQGASMAVAGAYVLAEELAREGATVQEALARYEARLKPEIEKRQASGRRIAGWFVPDNRVQLAVSNLILRGSTWPVVKGFVRRTLTSGSKI